MSHTTHSAKMDTLRRLKTNLRNVTIHTAPEADANNNQKTWSTVKKSDHAANTVNPIRKIVDALNVPMNPEKAPIRLHLGDPTLTGNMPPPPAAVAAIHQTLLSETFNGYGPSVGAPCARQAVVDRYSTPAAPFTADDVILASGASHALQMAIEAIADPGDNILVPAPGFPLYATLMKPHGIEEVQYRLRMESDAMIDIEDLESKITPRTKAIIINNPSNPTGAVFPKQLLEDVLRIAEQYKIVIIADEIYGDMVYGGAEFHPLYTLAPQVPIITCDGIAKRWLVPGWRLGWCIIHNRHGVLDEVKEGMVALSQKIVGPCSLVQGALPKILKETPEDFFQGIRDIIHQNATIVFDALSRIPGLRPVRPNGAMYMMVQIDKKIHGHEKAFVQGLIQEQSVFCLPGSAFYAEGYFRVVLTYEPEVTKEACSRIAEFCGVAEVEEEEAATGYESDEGCVDVGKLESSEEEEENERAVSPSTLRRAPVVV